MGAKRIIFRLNPKTMEKEFEIEGFPGMTCDTLTEALLRTKGVEEKERQLTSETFIKKERPDYVNNS